jgi:hypothetical protein
MKYLACKIPVHFLFGALAIFLNGNLLAREAFDDEKVKATVVFMSDANPLRYDYHYYDDDFYKNYDNEWNVSMDVGYRFQQTFHNKKLAALLFQYNPIQAANSSDFYALANTFENENLLAYGLALGQGASSTAEMEAKIRNNYINISIDITNADWNTYLHVGLPVQNARHYLKMTEAINLGDGTLPKGYATSEQTAMSVVLSDFFNYPEAASTNLSPIGSLKKYFSGTKVGDMQARSNAIAYFDGVNSKWALSDVYLQLGWEGWKRETSHLGFYLKTVIPTGNKMDDDWSKYTFSPVCGNARRWELGAGINAHVDLSKKNDVYWRVDIDGYLSHLFSAIQRRTFDLVNGPLTRYGMVKVFDGALNYLNKLVWAADVTTQNLKVYVPVKGEFILNVLYLKNNHEINFGYSFKGQQQECTEDYLSVPKGNVYGFAAQGEVQTPAVDLSSWGTNFITPNADMYSPSLNDLTVSTDGNEHYIFGKPITAANSVSADDISLRSGLMDAQVINMLFAGYRYNFGDIENCDDTFNPFVGIKGSVGLSPQSCYTPETWDVGVDVGLTF